MAGPAEEAVTEVAQEELFTSTVTHQWELAEVEDYYTEELEAEAEEPEPAVVLTSQRFGTAEASLREDGSILIPLIARPILRWWLPGGQSLFVTLAKLNAPKASWRMYATHEPGLLTEWHLGACDGTVVVRLEEEFAYCAACGHGLTGRLWRLPMMPSIGSWSRNLAFDGVVWQLESLNIPKSR